MAAKAEGESAAGRTWVGQGRSTHSRRTHQATHHPASQAPAEEVRTNINPHESSFDAPTEEALAAATAIDDLLYASAQDMFEAQLGVLQRVAARSGGALGGSSSQAGGGSNGVNTTSGGQTLECMLAALQVRLVALLPCCCLAAAPLVSRASSSWPGR